MKDLEELLASLLEEHAELNKEIDAMESSSMIVDQITLQRLKKNKLRLKDEIEIVRSKLHPDIIA
ncbi:MAG: YdcH family protein [Rickettsiaceae bacterium]|nr:YdcH family protein [Rickettsiaceae bacterium]